MVWGKKKAEQQVDMDELARLKAEYEEKLAKLNDLEQSGGVLDASSGKLSKSEPVQAAPEGKTQPSQGVEGQQVPLVASEVLICELLLAILNELRREK